MKQLPDASQTCLELCIQVGKELYKRFDRRLGALGLTPVQAQVLAALADTEGLSMRDLGERLCCVDSNVTAIVGRMVEAGWVERHPDPQDARVRRVRITPQGRGLLAAATEAPRCCPELAALLSPREWADLRRLIGKIRSRLQAEP
jgi:DNA-binding MarR family transcriptional regulator